MRDERRRRGLWRACWCSARSASEVKLPGRLRLAAGPSHAAPAVQFHALLKLGLQIRRGVKTSDHEFRRAIRGTPYLTTHATWRRRATTDSPRKIYFVKFRVYHRCLDFHATWRRGAEMWPCSTAPFRYHPIDLISRAPHKRSARL